MSSKVKAKILAVDDESDILDLIRYNLEKEGYKIICAVSGEECLIKAREKLPDLIILDLMLPGIDGLEVCRTLKSDSKTRHIPVIMLTAKGEEADIVTGIEMGADDYIPKPFSPRILAVRVKSVLRRVKESASETEGDVLKRNGLIIDCGRREVTVEGRKRELTFTEFEILYVLAKRPGWVFSRNQLINAVKGSGYPVTERSIDVQIVGLRKKIGNAAEYIETIRGVGYRFKD